MDVAEERSGLSLESLARIAGLLVIFGGLVAWCIRLESKVGELERAIEKQDKEIERFQTEFLRTELYRANMETTNERLRQITTESAQIRQTIKRFQ